MFRNYSAAAEDTVTVRTVRMSVSNVANFFLFFYFKACAKYD